MTMFILNDAMPLMLDCAVKVKVSVVTWFAAKTVPSRFQVSLIGPLAAAGFQLVVAIFRVNAVFPVFLTYTVLDTELPGDKFPQLIEDIFCVHALSE
jgi:hypothetical protein